MKINKVLFIHSSYYADNGKLVKANSLFDRLTILNLAEMGLPLLAAYTPSYIKVEMADDCLDETPFDTDAEIIAITAMLFHLDRALFLADEFKKRGKIVVMGGFLPTQYPELVIDHVDSICIGEGDQIWPQMIKDIENDSLKPKYISDFKMSLNKIPIPRYDLIKRNRFFPINPTYPVQATRGCPFYCNYCSIVAFYKNSYRHRPVEDIIRDIKAHGSKFMYFVDDNLFENKAFAKELMRNMIGLNVRWAIQSTINIANDKELLVLAYKAGCRTIMAGIESILNNNLISLSKSWSDVNNYKKAIKTIQDAGIGVHALIVFGMPDDTSEIFDTTVDFLEECGVTGAEFFIFIPYPATPIGKKFLKEGKIIDKNYSHYRDSYVVFSHPNMSSKEIQKGYWRALKRFYSLKSILIRLIKNKSRNRSFQIIKNLYYWLKIKRGIPPTHFQRGNYKTP